MGAKERVRVMVDVKGVYTKVTVETLQRTAINKEDEKWVRNLEVTTKNLEIREGDEISSHSLLP